MGLISEFLSLSLRFSRAHDFERLQVSFPGVVSSNYETLRFNVCQPRREEGQITAAHSVVQTLRLSSALNKYVVFLSVCQAVEELLVELDLDKKSIVVGASRVRMCLNSSHQTAERESGWCDSRIFFLLCLRCSWSEVCCATWSSRETSRSPAGWSIYRPPAWDIWLARNTENSRWASPCLSAVMVTYCQTGEAQQVKRKCQPSSCLNEVNVIMSRSANDTYFLYL